MAENLDLGGVRELKLGASFSNNKAPQYHTIKYDFKPASVDVNKMATVEVGTTNQVTVTVPHLDGAGTPQTIFKGNHKPYTKECVLFINRVTGEIILEKLSSNIQVKKTRPESTSKPRPLTPVDLLTNTTQRSSSRTRVTSGGNRRINPVGGLGPSNMPRYPGAPHKTPPTLMRSPPRVKTSPPQAAPWAGGGHSTLASLPMIGLDEVPMQNGYAHATAPPPPPAPSRPLLPHPPVERNPTVERSGVPERNGTERNHVLERMTPPERNGPLPQRTLPPPQSAPVNNNSIQNQPIAQNGNQSSSSSSSESGSDSDSGNSGSDSEDDSRRPNHNHPLTNGVGSISQPPLLSDVLNDDLCLSESGSDSD